MILQYYLILSFKQSLLSLGEAKENVKDEDEEDEVQGFLFSELK